MALVSPGMFESLLSEEIIAKYIKGQQNFRKGKALVACGFVSQISLMGDLKSDEHCLHVSAFIHAEMTANKFYLVKICITHDGIAGSLCVCEARKHHHHMCKHTAALLLSLLLLSEHADSPPNWIESRKKKIKRMTCEVWAINERIRANITFDEIKKGFFSPPPQHWNGKPALLVTKSLKGGSRKHETSESKKKKKVDLNKLSSATDKKVAIAKKVKTGRIVGEGGKERAASEEKKETSKAVRVEEVVNLNKPVRKGAVTSFKEQGKESIAVSSKNPSRKRNREEIIYPAEIAVLSEFARETWRINQIYSQNKRIKFA